MEYMTHDPAIFEDPVTKQFYIYPTTAEAMSSADLVRFNPLGKVVTEVPKEAKSWTNSEQIWAPDIVKVGDEYRLYCSNSSWGVRQSCIFLAVADKAEGPFVPRGVVIKTDDTLPVNAIDANIIEDKKTGEQYMVYGSFWGGVHLLPLDKTTGLALNRDELSGAEAGESSVEGHALCGVGSMKLRPGYTGESFESLSGEEQEKRIGKCLAKRPSWTSTGIEGPYIIYHPETEYYYLFVSYGSLKSDYNIRVGRSKDIKGPYLDFYGNDMADPDDADCTRGLMVAAGYRWLTGQAYMGPGHNSVLLRENGDMYLVSHIRKLRFLEDNPGEGLLQIRKMYMSESGWPLAEAQPYEGEIPVGGSETTGDGKSDGADDDGKKAGISAGSFEKAVIGKYERILLQPMMPQGICHSHPLFIFEDGYLESCSIQGNWEMTGKDTMKITYGPNTEWVHVACGRDAENEKDTILLTGLTDKGFCTWAKRVKD